jgi:hypothetical protein
MVPLKVTSQCMDESEFKLDGWIHETNEIKKHILLQVWEYILTWIWPSIYIIYIYSFQTCELGVP